MRGNAADAPLILAQKYLQEHKEAVLNCCVLLGVLIFIIYQARCLYAIKTTKNGQTEHCKIQRGEKVGKTADKNVFCRLNAVEDYVEVIQKDLHSSAIIVEDDSLRNSQIFYESMRSRRVTGLYKDIAVPFKVIQNIVKTADTCPSFSPLEQPWTICVIGADKTKCEIRHVVEEAAKKSYAIAHGLADEAEDSNMVAALSHIWSKSYLSEAPFVIVLFAQVSRFDEQGNWVPIEGAESAVATLLGILIAAIQVSGLATVATAARHCDAQIRHLLHRPSTERLQFILPIGFPCGGKEKEKEKEKEKDEAAPSRRRLQSKRGASADPDNPDSQSSQPDRSRRARSKSRPIDQIVKLY